MSLQIGIVEQKIGQYLVSLNGRLDTDTSPMLEKRLKEVLARPSTAVRFDMSQLNYISSMGIRVLFETLKTLRQKNGMFLVVNLQPQIKKVLDIARALPAETVFASLEEADRYFDAMQKKALGQEADES